MKQARLIASNPAWLAVVSALSLSLAGFAIYGWIAAYKITVGGFTDPMDYLFMAEFYRAFLYGLFNSPFTLRRLQRSEDLFAEWPARHRPGETLFHGQLCILVDDRQCTIHHFPPVPLKDIFG